MTEVTQDLSLAQARSLIDSYAFDLGCDNSERLFESWLDLYHASWIRLATIEALYLGRYKAISVEHILNVWLRIGTPNPHFTYEFERLICRKLPKHLSDLSDLTASATKSPVVSSYESQPEVEPEVVTVVDTTSDSNLNREKVLRSHVSESNTSLISAAGMSYESNWSDLNEGTKTIHQFIPLPDVSSFFTKLKTFGE